MRRPRPRRRGRPATEEVAAAAINEPGLRCLFVCLFVSVLYALVCCMRLVVYDLCICCFRGGVREGTSTEGTEAKGHLCIYVYINII